MRARPDLPRSHRGSSGRTGGRLRTLLVLVTAAALVLAVAIGFLTSGGGTTSTDSVASIRSAAADPGHGRAGRNQATPPTTQRGGGAVTGDARPAPATSEASPSTGVGGTVGGTVDGTVDGTDPTGGSQAPGSGGGPDLPAPAPLPPATSPGVGVAGAWLSGATEVDGSFDAWRGSPVQSATHWADSQEACENQWGMTDLFGDWNGTLVVAVGGLWGQSWSEAASGGMDATWTQCLDAMASAWGSKPPANLIISLFHEANGTWYDWSVSEGDVAHFQAAFARFRHLQQQIIPGSQLAFVLNAEHLQGGYDAADMLPAAGDYDLLGVDMYSMHDHVDFGQFPALALSAGKPLIVQEWGIKDDEGGGADFVQYMWDQFQQYGGTGPGRVELENYFDLNEYAISSSTSSPDGAERYRSLW